MMRIIKIVIDGDIPPDCGHCYHRTTREKGRDVFYECYFIDKWIENLDTRPDWCPLVTNDAVMDWIESGMNYKL
jgi:hypothetical protein